jgi:putative zinc finger protein
MLVSTDCPPLEEVAAFAEGRLRGADRERLIAHLAGCADCREVLAETIETAEELAAEDRPGVIAPMPATRPARSPWLVRGAAAAATVAIVGAVVVSQVNATRSPPSPDEWLAEMPAATNLAPHVWGGVRMRGAGVPGPMLQQSTELGALLVDVRVTSVAGDVEMGSDVLTRMAAIVEDAGFMGEEDVSTLQAIARESDNERRRALLAAKLPAIEERMRERFEPAVLDLGTFAEEAQIAARAGDRSFLESRAARRYLDWVLSQPHGTLPSEDRNTERLQLPEQVTAALRTLQRKDATPEQQGEAADAILGR